MFLHPEVQFQGAAETFIFYVFTCIPFLKYMYTKKYYCYRNTEFLNYQRLVENPLDFVKIWLS